MLRIGPSTVLFIRNIAKCARITVCLSIEAFAFPTGRINTTSGCYGVSMDTNYMQKLFTVRILG
ncbi:hypothetical protein UA17_00803 [Burkholderia multivorans]|nr:hypothetical protein UA17_00803 [Burkholderia multivorans]